MERTCHEIRVPKSQFADLRRGKPLLVWKDTGQCPGELLVASEYDEDELRTTETFALYRIAWVTRGSDDEGLLEAAALERLVPHGLVLLTLIPGGSNRSR
jgi:hypothetical protein